MFQVQHDVKDLYDSWHVQRGTSESCHEFRPHPWHLTASRLLPKLDGQRVLEIGCGRGDFSLWLKQRFPSSQITAVDFSDAAIELASERALALGVAVSFLVSDAQDMPLESMSFDVIVSCECLEHIPVPMKMIKEIHRLLRPGGVFVLTTENYLNGMLLAWAKSWITKTPYDSGSGVQPIENFFIYWSVRKLFQRCGLLVEHMESNHYQWLLLPRIASARLCTEDFRSRRLKRFFRPFGRHFAFRGIRPE